MDRKNEGNCNMEQRLEEEKKLRKALKNVKCRKKQGLQPTAIAYSIKDHLVLSVHIIHSIAQMNLSLIKIYITIKNYNE